MADTHVPTDLDEAKAAVRDLADEVGDQLGDAGEVTAERLEEALAVVAERLVDARDVLADRARTHGPELAAWARSTGADIADRAGPVLSQRAEQARSEVSRRWQDLEGDLPVEVDVEKVGRQVERGLWQVGSALLGVLLLVPRLLVRALGAFGTFADDVADRGVVAGDRAREAVAAVPPSRRDRRRRAVRTAAWTGTGFGLGLLVGWLAGRRDVTTVTYEPADLGAHLDHDDASPAAFDAHPVPPDPDPDLPEQDDAAEAEAGAQGDDGAAEDGEDRG